MMKFTATDYTSLFKTKWLSIRRTSDDFTYVHVEVGNSHGVAVLGWRESGENGLEILGRFEPNPAHKEINNVLVSLTGGMERRFGDLAATALHYAAEELNEEAGIEADKNSFIALGTIRPSKISDMTMHLFSINLDDKEPSDTSKGDGSQLEKGTYCKWISLKEAIASKDPILHCLILRADILKLNV